jgi:hypothetical protein
LGFIQGLVDRGRLGANPNGLLTMKTLYDTDAILRTSRSKKKLFSHGIKLLAGGASYYDVPLHFEVTDASRLAVRRIYECGGSVTLVYYNKLGLQALLEPEKFDRWTIFQSDLAHFRDRKINPDSGTSVIVYEYDDFIDNESLWPRGKPIPIEEHFTIFSKSAKNEEQRNGRLLLPSDERFFRTLRRLFHGNEERVSELIANSPMDLHSVPPHESQPIIVRRRVRMLPNYARPPPRLLLRYPLIDEHRRPIKRLNPNEVVNS